MIHVAIWDALAYRIRPAHQSDGAIMAEPHRPWPKARRAGHFPWPEGREDGRHREWRREGEAPQLVTYRPAGA